MLVVAGSRAGWAIFTARPLYSGHRQPPAPIRDPAKTEPSAEPATAKQWQDPSRYVEPNRTQFLRFRATRSVTCVLSGCQTRTCDGIEGLAIVMAQHFHGSVGVAAYAGIDYGAMLLQLVALENIF